MAVGKPLPDDALERSISALGITNAKGNPLTIPEVELGKIATQVPFGAMLVHALHASFENAEIAFNRVRMSLAAPGGQMSVDIEIKLSKNSGRMCLRGTPENPRPPGGVPIRPARGSLAADTAV